jgi:mannose-6-phosphate isomerase-like protein (cupin superfamily)
MTDYDIHLDDKFGSLMLIDIEGGDTVVLDPHQGYTVPRRVEHRTRAPVRTAIVMVEAAGVQPTGD